jgi:SAM-dependent methyltransferase
MILSSLLRPRVCFHIGKQSGLRSITCGCLYSSGFAKSGFAKKEKSTFGMVPTTSSIIDRIPASASHVLDIGCGSGRLLAAAKSPFGCGIDIDLCALRTAKSQAPHVHFVSSYGERLPFKSEQFDHILSIVALPYMDIPLALSEFARVLKPSGTIFVTLHPSDFVWRELADSFRSLNWQNIVYRPYVLLNGVLFHFTGKVMRFPLKRSRIESFQTPRGMGLALQAAGFGEIKIEHISGKFILSAKKQSR